MTSDQFLANKADKVIRLSHKLQETFSLKVDEAYKIAIMAGIKDEENYTRAMVENGFNKSNKE